MSDTSPPPPPKRRKNMDKHKTKVSEPSQPDQSNVYPTPVAYVHVSILDVPSTPAADVHSSADSQKVNYVISDIEELKDHLKNYIN